MGARELLGEAVDVVEEAVGLVLVFLLQFGLVDLLVVEGLSGCGNSMGGRDDWLEGASSSGGRVGLVEFVLDRSLEVVGGDGRSVSQDLALGRLGLGSRGAKVAGSRRDGAAGHHRGSGLDGHGLTHDRALLSHMDESVGGHGGLWLLGERAKSRGGGIAEERAGFGGEFHC